MKKNISYLIIACLVLMTSCHDPEYVSPTTERQGITRLVAKFTSGENEGKIAVEYDIADATQERFVIPVPWYFPESSTNETTDYMTAMKIEVNIANNCHIDPPITILDLSKDNFFTFTEPNGAQRQICITGERTKSNKSQLLSFSLLSPEISGIIDQEKRTVSLITPDDLSSCLAEYALSAHATISPDPLEALDYNTPVELTVIAHNGIDKTTYTILKEVPDKINYGFRANSAEQIFSIDLDQTGMPWLATNAPSLGAVNNHLVLCMGDGTTPIYMNRITGVKIGEMNVGSIAVRSVANDNANNLLLFNQANGGETFNIWKANSVTSTPELFYSMTNPSSLPIGIKVKVQGDINGDAIIIATCEGISGVTSSNQFIRIVVSGGVIGTPEVVTVGVTGWGAGPVNCTTVVAASTNIADGYFLSYYGANQLYHFNGSTNTVSTQLDGDNWMMNRNCLDAKPFNNARYMVLFSVNHFPQWSGVPNIHLFDITNMSTFTGTIDSSQSLVFVNNNLPSFQGGDGINAAGDVLLVPSQNGYNLHLYYFDNNCKSLGAYAFDCIDK